MQTLNLVASSVGEDSVVSSWLLTCTISRNLKKKKTYTFSAVVFIELAYISTVKMVVLDCPSVKKLVLKFCQFFVEMVNCITNNILEALASSARRVFDVRPHKRPDLSLFWLVTVDEV